MKRKTSHPDTKNNLAETARRYAARVTRMPTITPSKRDGWIQ
ncbi:hypothetical protein [Roseovarius sp. EL26]|nr:hypothetical protein [Roseovarius sp. EL26]